MKRTDELNKIRAMESSAAEELVRSSEEELMKLRFRKAANQLSNSAQIKKLRQQVARTRTVLRERELMSAGEAK